MKKIIKALHIFFAYIVVAVTDIKRLAKAVNEASSPEEMDELILGGK